MNSRDSDRVHTPDLSASPGKKDEDPVGGSSARNISPMRPSALYQKNCSLEIIESNLTILGLRPAAGAPRLR